MLASAAPEPVSARSPTPPRARWAARGRRRGDRDVSVGSRRSSRSASRARRRAATDDAPLADAAKLASGSGATRSAAATSWSSSRRPGSPRGAGVVARGEAGPTTPGSGSARHARGADGADPGARRRSFGSDRRSPTRRSPRSQDVFATLTAGSRGADDRPAARARRRGARRRSRQTCGSRADFLESEIWAFFDDVVERLEHVAPRGRRGAAVEPDRGDRSAAAAAPARRRSPSSSRVQVDHVGGRPASR